MRATVLATVLACHALASCGGPEPRARTSPPRPRWVAAAAPVLRENDEHVIGGPLDETDFDFDSELPRVPEPLHFEVPSSVEHTPLAALEPYLDLAPTELVGRDPTGDGLLVLARHDASTQVHRVREPLATREAVTALPDPVIQAAPVPGRRDLVTVRTDPGGSEDYHISVLRPPSEVVASPSRRGERHGSFRWSPDGAWLAFTANRRHPVYMDLCVAPAGALSEPRVIGGSDGLWNVVAFSRDSRRVVVRDFRTVLDSRLWLVEVEDGSSTPVALPGGARAATLDARMGPSGALYVATDRGEEHVRLFRFEPPDRLEPLGGQPPWDVEGIAVSPDGGALAYVTNERGYSVVRVLELRGGSERALAIPPGVVRGLTWLRAGVLAFNHDPGTRPQEVCTYALDRDELVRWTSTPAPGTPIEPVLTEVESFDGVPVPALVYRPRTEGPHPVLLWIHGGPEEQHRPTYNPIIQYVAGELGVAVVAPNVRGSRGYGRTFLSLDDGLRREDAIRDVGAVLDWVAAQPDLDAARVGIHGASYGGFVVLASLARYPDRFVAGSDLVGISDIATFLENTRPYRRDLRRLEYGDESDPETRVFLDAISPLSRAHLIRAPLLVAHGANDPRVPVGEALQITDAVREAGTEVWLMVAPGEGHSFARRPSRDAFYRLFSRFLERHLLGRGASEARATPGS